jgi:hypothetical protein
LDELEQRAANRSFADWFNFNASCKRLESGVSKVEQQKRTGKLERDLQTNQERTSNERDLQPAANEVERLTLERNFCSERH